MIRKEFAELVTNLGMATVKLIRPLLNNKKEDEITEFSLLGFENFDDKKFAQAAAQKYKIPFIDLSNASVPENVQNLIKKTNVIRYRIFPIQKREGKIVLATFDPTILEKEKEVSTLIRSQVEIILTTISAWKKLFEEVRQSVDEILSTIKEVDESKLQDEKIDEQDIGQDVITMVNRILAEAYLKKVSDIHIEPYEKKFRVRFRLDGELREAFDPPRSMMLPLISRMKIMAKMDISEKRVPQDGRIKLMVAGRPIDYRVSSLPTLFGEKIVLRLLDSSNLQLDMTKLGFEKKQIEVFQEAIHRPFGMVLVTGPTGSGKTTTLYSAIAELNCVDVNISTAEDPVEFNLEGVNQVNVKKEVGLTFASALKAFLRQDPDIVLIGEIRDFETGEIGVEAALTGHMVLSTLHTNDASATVTRLLNMGIEPFLVTAALNCIVAQRLARRICPNCKEEVKIPKEQLVAAGVSPASAEKMKTYQGKGCDACGGSGYKGRVAIYEVLAMTPRLRELVLRHASSDEIKMMAIKEGMKTLRMSALTKVAQGQTTLEQALSNSGSDDVAK